MKIANFFYGKEKKYLQEIKKSKKFVIELCKKNKLKYRMTDANFFHLYFERKKIKDIFFGLKKNKILIKSNYLGSFIRSSRSIRVTLGNINQMKYFFKHLIKLI